MIFCGAPPHLMAPAGCVKMALPWFYDFLGLRGRLRVSIPLFFLGGGVNGAGRPLLCFWGASFRVQGTRDDSFHQPQSQSHLLLPRREPLHDRPRVLGVLRVCFIYYFYCCWCACGVGGGSTNPISGPSRVAVAALASTGRTNVRHQQLTII